MCGLRRSKCWGQARIAARTGVPASTVRRILVRNGLNRLSWIDRPTGRVIRRHERPHPGDLVRLDVKKVGKSPHGGGWRAHGRVNTASRGTRRRPRVGYSYLHVAVDDHSRLAYVEALDDETADTLCGFFERARIWFRSIGVAVDEVVSDNGANFRSKRFAAQLARHEITATITVTFAAVVHTRRPSTPQGLRCAAATETTATWVWGASDRAHSYWYRYSSSDDWSRAGGAGDLSHTRTGITPSSTYNGWGNARFFQVLARNNVGDSAPVYTTCLTLPPDWLTAECSATGQIAARWSKPLGLNSEIGLRYTATATYGVPSVLGVGSLDPYTGTALTHTFAGTPGATYTIKVQTNHIAGKPAYSETATAECEITVPAAVQVECREDGKVYASWAGPDDARRYRLTIGISGGSTTARTVTEYVPATAQANPPTTYTRTGVVGARYSIAVAAHDGTEWSADSTPAADTCEATAPPAPAGVTASCSSGTLTVTWDSAGVGLSKATAYKPRIFTGDPLTESTKWTANTAGHDTTTATIPATGEDDLPTTGTFQVKIKATNTAGDSAYSNPVEATCGKPGPVGDLKCTAATHGSISIEWSGAVGADSYEVRGTRLSDPSLYFPWQDIGAPEKILTPGKFSYTVTGLEQGLGLYNHTLYLRAKNDRGDGPEASVSCRTVDEDWLNVDCTANGVLDVSWDNPPDSSQSHVVTVGVDGALQPSWRTRTFAGSETRWTMLAAPTKAYRASIESRGAGGPVYSQAATKTCPALSTPDYNGPNVPEGLPGWLGWIEPILNLLCIDDSCSNWQNSTSTDVGSIATYTPIFIGGDYAVVPKSRDCRRSTDTATGHVTQTCDEVWNEHISVRVDESSLDETAATLVDFYIPEDIPDINATTIENAITYAATTLASYWEAIEAAGALGVRAAVKLSLTAAAGHAVGVWLYHEANQPWAEINGLDNCVFDPPENRGSDIKAWNRQSSTVNATTTVGNITTTRNATVHYCQEEE